MPNVNPESSEQSDQEPVSTEHLDATVSNEAEPVDDDDDVPEVIQVIVINSSSDTSESENEDQIIGEYQPVEPHLDEVGALQLDNYFDPQSPLQELQFGTDYSEFSTDTDPEYETLSENSVNHNCADDCSNSAGDKNLEGSESVHKESGSKSADEPSNQQNQAVLSDIADSDSGVRYVNQPSDDQQSDNTLEPVELHRVNSSDDVRNELSQPNQVDQNDDEVLYLLNENDRRNSGEESVYGGTGERNDQQRNNDNNISHDNQLCNVDESIDEDNQDNSTNEERHQNAISVERSDVAEASQSNPIGNEPILNQNDNSREQSTEVHEREIRKGLFACSDGSFRLVIDESNDNDSSDWYNGLEVVETNWEVYAQYELELKKKAEKARLERDAAEEERLKKAAAEKERLQKAAAEKEEQPVVHVVQEGEQGVDQIPIENDNNDDLEHQPVVSPDNIDELENEADVEDNLDCPELREQTASPDYWVPVGGNENLLSDDYDEDASDTNRETVTVLRPTAAAPSTNFLHGLNFRTESPNAAVVQSEPSDSEVSEHIPDAPDFAELYSEDDDSEDDELVEDGEESSSSGDRSHAMILRRLRIPFGDNNTDELSSSTERKLFKDDRPDNFRVIKNKSNIVYVNSSDETDHRKHKPFKYPYRPGKKRQKNQALVDSSETLSKRAKQSSSESIKDGDDDDKDEEDNSKKSLGGCKVGCRFLFDSDSSDDNCGPKRNNGSAGQSASGLTTESNTRANDQSMNVDNDVRNSGVEVMEVSEMVPNDGDISMNSATNQVHGIDDLHVKNNSEVQNVVAEQTKTTESSDHAEQNFSTNVNTQEVGVPIENVVDGQAEKGNADTEDTYNGIPFVIINVSDSGNEPSDNEEVETMIANLFARNTPIYLSSENAEHTDDDDVIFVKTVSTVETAQKITENVQHQNCGAPEKNASVEVINVSDKSDDSVGGESVIYVKSVPASKVRRESEKMTDSKGYQNVKKVNTSGGPVNNSKNVIERKKVRRRRYIKKDLCPDDSDDSTFELRQIDRVIEHPDYNAIETGYEYDEYFSDGKHEKNIPGMTDDGVDNYVPRQKPAHMHKSDVNRSISCAKKIYSDVLKSKTIDYNLVDKNAKQLSDAISMNQKMQLSIIEEIAKLVCDGSVDVVNFEPDLNLEPAKCIHPKAAVTSMADATQFCSEKANERRYVVELWWTWIETNLPKLNFEMVNELLNEFNTMTEEDVSENSTESETNDETVKSDEKHSEQDNTDNQEEEDVESYVDPDASKYYINPPVVSVPRADGYDSDDSASTRSEEIGRPVFFKQKNVETLSSSKKPNIVTEKDQGRTVMENVVDETIHSREESENPSRNDSEHSSMISFVSSAPQSPTVDVQSDADESVDSDGQIQKAILANLIRLQIIENGEVDEKFLEDFLLSSEDENDCENESEISNKSRSQNDVDSDAGADVEEVYEEEQNGESSEGESIYYKLDEVLENDLVFENSTSPSASDHSSDDETCVHPRVFAFEKSSENGIAKDVEITYDNSKVWHSSTPEPPNDGYCLCGPCRQNLKHKLSESHPDDPFSAPKRYRRENRLYYSEPPVIPKSPKTVPAKPKPSNKKVKWRRMKVLAAKTYYSFDRADFAPGTIGYRCRERSRRYRQKVLKQQRTRTPSPELPSHEEREHLSSEKEALRMSLREHDHDYKKLVNTNVFASWTKDPFYFTKLKAMLKHGFDTNFRENPTKFIPRQRVVPKYDQENEEQVIPFIDLTNLTSDDEIIFGSDDFAELENNSERQIPSAVDLDILSPVKELPYSALKVSTYVADDSSADSESPSVDTTIAFQEKDAESKEPSVEKTMQDVNPDIFSWSAKSVKAKFFNESTPDLEWTGSEGSHMADDEMMDEENLLTEEDLSTEEGEEEEEEEVETISSDDEMSVDRASILLEETNDEKRSYEPVRLNPNNPYELSRYLEQFEGTSNSSLSTESSESEKEFTESENEDVCYKNVFNDLHAREDALPGSAVEFNENNVAKRVPSHLLKYCLPVTSEDQDIVYDTLKDVLEYCLPEDAFEFDDIQFEAGLVAEMRKAGVFGLTADTEKVFDKTEAETILNIGSVQNKNEKEDEAVYGYDGVFEDEEKKDDHDVSMNTDAEEKEDDENDDVIDDISSIHENQTVDELKKELSAVRAQLKVATLQFRSKTNTILELMHDQAERHELTDLLIATEAKLFDNFDGELGDEDAFEMACAYDELQNYYKDQGYNDSIKNRAQRAG